MFSRKQKGMQIDCHTTWVEVFSVRLFMGISLRPKEKEHWQDFEMGGLMYWLPQMLLLVDWISLM